MTLWIRGQYDPAANRWAGSIRARVVVRRRGRTLARCNLRTTYWTANAA